MKILWIVNTIFPYPAKKLNINNTNLGGWLNGLANEIVKEKKIKLAIASIYSGSEIKKYDDDNIIYYLIPGAPALKYNKNINQYCRTILDEFKPDILHIHGTEFAHGLSFINVCDEKIKKVVSIQGMTSCYSKVYLAKVPYKEIIKNITFRDIIKRDNIFQQKKKFAKRGIYEKKIINKCDFIIGRTDWDYYNSIAINNSAKYFNLPETVRECFYKNNWNIKNIERNSIYLSQGGYPIKGLHILLKAMEILKSKYQNIKLYISGSNIIKSDSAIEKIKLSGYGKYIKSLIKRYKLQDNVIFTGILNEKQIIERLLKTHVVVVPSVIENESNSLTEAHLLGMPTVATFTGGMTDRIIHKKTGFFYPFSEPAMCAGYISKIFEDDELETKLGQSAREEALERNNQENNRKKIFEIYNNILGEY